MKLGSEIIETSDNLSFSEFKEILRTKILFFWRSLKIKVLNIF
jgi:hypothetical protein